MMFDRSAILRAAHAGARSKIANSRAWRTYREALSASLKHEWRIAKREAAEIALAAEDAAEAASHQIPADVARRVSDLRVIAEAQTFTAYGSHRRTLILAEADDLEAATRCAMAPASPFVECRHAY